MNLENKGKNYTVTVAGQELTWEFGKYAFQSESSVLASWGDTRVMVTVDVGEQQPEGDYLPLGVEYLEKFYASGMISGSRFVKREKFPGLEAVLAARMTDRMLRPRFPKGLTTPITLIITVLSYAEDSDPVTLGMNTASLALMGSCLPFKGPVAGVRITLDKDGEPQLSSQCIEQDDELEKLPEMNMVLGLDADGIIMFDAAYDNIPADKVKAAMDLAEQEAKPILEAQQEFIQELSVEKKEYDLVAPAKEIVHYIKENYHEKVKESVYATIKQERGALQDEVLAALQEEKTAALADEDSVWSDFQIRLALEKVMKEVARESILETRKHVDGRGFDQVRELEMELDQLPRAHGSAMFRRGDSSVLSSVTLGSPERVQVLDGMTGEDTRRYMHHYNDQPYTYGEASRVRYHPSRRALGHGALAEKALIPVLPEFNDFPYTIRVVSEVMTSGGSTSMAATCGSSLAMMTAGVPIKEPVAGIHVGMVSQDNFTDYQLLVDIVEIEDFYGDMDFKVTGTKEGITAIQMDQKQDSIPVSILKEALDLASQARQGILEQMNEVIAKPRTEVSEYAPRSEVINIDEELIGKVIGPGGKTIKEITSKSGCDIVIEDDGRIMISGTTAESRELAKELINKELADTDERGGRGGRGNGRGNGRGSRPPQKQLKIGEVYAVTVAKVMPFGLIVEEKESGQSGLIHISELQDGYVRDIEGFAEEGEELQARLIDREDRDRLRFSLKAV